MGSLSTSPPAAVVAQGQSACLRRLRSWVRFLTQYKNFSLSLQTHIRFSFYDTHLGHRAFFSLIVFFCTACQNHSKPLPSFFFLLNSYENLCNVKKGCCSLFLYLFTFAVTITIVGTQLPGRNWCCSSTVEAEKTFSTYQRLPLKVIDTKLFTLSGSFLGS